jgi:hypothetical protein
MDLGHVLGQDTVADLHVAEVSLDHPEGVLNAGGTYATSRRSRRVSSSIAGSVSPYHCEKQWIRRIVATG